MKRGCGKLAPKIGHKDCWMDIPKDDKEQQVWMLDLLINHYGVGGHVIDPANHVNLIDLARLKTGCGQENRDTVDFVNTWIELATKILRYQSLTTLADFT